MKIIQYIAESGWGGGPQHVLWLSEELKRENHNVEIWTSSKLLIEKSKSSGILAVLVPHPRRKAMMELRKLLRKENPCLIHLHGVRAGIIGGWSSKNLPHTLCYTEHHLTKDIPMSPWRKSLQCRLLKSVLREASAVIAPSRATAEFLLTNHLVSENKLHLVPHGLPKITTPMPMKIGLTEPIIGTIGSLLPVKNIDLLIRALYLMPDVSLAILGSGPDKNKLLDLVKRLKLQNRVAFLGSMDDPYPYLASLELYLQPSSSESFGLSVLQAMQIGLVSLVSNRGALPELIQNNKDGLVIEEFTPQAWSKSILDLLENSSKCKTLGLAASKKVLKDYSIEKMTKEVKRIYSEFLHWQ